MKSGKIALALCTLVFLGLFGALPLTRAQFTPPSGWNSWEEVTLTDVAWANHVNVPVDVLFTPAFGTCSSVDEIRVIAPDGVTEIPSQVYDVVTTSGYITSCRVVFLANCSALSSVTYYIIYNNPSATAPVYDGLRLHTETAGDTYNVTALVASVEKNYFRIFWKNLIDLYSNGVKITWPGGPAGWEFSQINLGTMWNDAWGATWFGAGKSLSVVNSGPVFVDFNYSESFATDFWGMLFNFNVTYTNMVRVYYQPNLNPLVRYKATFTLKTNLPNYTISGPVFMDFNLANSTSQAIYLNMTYSQGWFGTWTIPVETSLLWTSIWYPPWALYGWWTYNGSRPDSGDKPAANIGLVPTDASGTISADYQVSFTQDMANLDHHCTQWMIGAYNGTNGQTAGTTGYIVTYTLSSVDGGVTPFMNNEAAALRTPLAISFKPSLFGDLSKNWIVDIYDVVKAALAFGSRPGDPNWNPDADLDGNSLIDIFDMVRIGINYGNTDP